jgi:2-methylcitrate dehydratase PrpD
MERRSFLKTLASSGAALTAAGLPFKKMALADTNQENPGQHKSSEGSRSDVYTRQLATFAASLRFKDIPSPVVEHAKVCLLDTVGCGLFGSTLPWSKILVASLQEFETSGSSTIWGNPLKMSPASAALANGTMVHSFELDDLHKVSIVHPGSVVTTPALAVAEYLQGVSGKRFLTAVIAGYEVAARVGNSVGAAHLVAGWHPTGTHGTLGAAAAAGSLLRLNAVQMQNALGIAGSQSAGLMASQFSSMVKRYHAGRAAQSGVYSALLARRGFTGIMELFESEYGGYCSTFSPRYDLKKLTAGLGEKWEAVEVGFKSYSTNGSCHTTIDAILAVRSKYNLTPDQVDTITVYGSTATKEHVGWFYVPDSITTAQMNLSYIAAVTLTDGEAFVDQFTDQRIRDPKLVALASRVKVMADPAIDARGDANRHNIRMEIKLKDGRTLTDSRQNAKGSSALPLTLREVETKYERLAAKVLPDKRVCQLREIVHGVDNLKDVSQLAKALL